MTSTTTEAGSNGHTGALFEGLDVPADSARDLQALYAQIRAVEGSVGRAPIDPAILMSLWLYATLDGVGSARELDRLCESSDAYRWLCGGVGVNHHTLGDFRVEHTLWLDEQLTRIVADRKSVV